jgi:hypothetical protein
LAILGWNPGTVPIQILRSAHFRADDRGTGRRQQLLIARRVPGIKLVLWRRRSVLEFWTRRAHSGEYGRTGLKRLRSLRSNHLRRSVVNGDSRRAAIKKRDAGRAYAYRANRNTGRIDFYIEARRSKNSVECATSSKLNLDAPELELGKPNFAVLRDSNDICAINLDFGSSVR